MKRINVQCYSIQQHAKGAVLVHLLVKLRGLDVVVLAQGWLPGDGCFETEYYLGSQSSIFAKLRHNDHMIIYLPQKQW